MPETDEGVVERPEKAGKGSCEKGAGTGNRKRSGATAGFGVLANRQERERSDRDAHNPPWRRRASAAGLHLRGVRAQMYLGFEASGDGWRIRETRAGELVSVLLGCCAHVGRVSSTRCRRW